MGMKLGRLGNCFMSPSRLQMGAGRFSGVHPTLRIREGWGTRAVVTLGPSMLSGEGGKSVHPPLSHAHVC